MADKYWIKGVTDIDGPHCPRCSTDWLFDDDRCIICGMTWDTQGPAPRRGLRGIAALVD